MKQNKIWKKKDIELRNEGVFELVCNSDKPLDEIILEVKKLNISEEQLYSLIEEYHKSFEERLVQDKERRREIFSLFKDIEKGLERYRKEVDEIKIAPSISDVPKKNYCLINIGGEWVEPKIRKQGDKSFIIQH